MSIDEILALGWADAELRGLHWVDGGLTLALQIAFPNPESEGRVTDLRFSWAEGLSIQVSFGAGRGGFPLTWDAAFLQDSKGVWLVRLDFGGAGSLSFRCNDIAIMDGEVP